MKTTLLIRMGNRNDTVTLEFDETPEKVLLRIQSFLEGKIPGAEKSLLMDAIGGNVLLPLEMLQRGLFTAFPSVTKTSY